MIIKDLSIHVPTTLFSSAEKLRLEKESARPTTKQVFLLPKGSRKVTEAQQAYSCLTKQDLNVQFQVYKRSHH